MASLLSVGLTIPLPWLWFLLATIFGIIEAMTLGIVSIWFAIGALAAMLTSIFIDSVMIQMGVNLRRRDIGVAEHFLNAPQIGPVFHKMGRKRVAQGVRRYIRLNVRFLGIMFNQFPETLSAHRKPGTVGEQNVRLFILQHGLPDAVEVPLQRILRRAPKRDNPLFSGMADQIIHLHIHIRNF